jgi:hypothetical protein
MKITDLLFLHESTLGAVVLQFLFADPFGCVYYQGKDS